MDLCINYDPTVPLVCVCVHQPTPLVPQVLGVHVHTGGVAGSRPAAAHLHHQQ